MLDKEDPRKTRPDSRKKCKRVLEERYQARLMLLNRQTEENKKRYEVARKTADMQARKKRKFNEQAKDNTRKLQK
jgi:hypothetical protein